MPHSVLMKTLNVSMLYFQWFGAIHCQNMSEPEIEIN